MAARRAGAAGMTTLQLFTAPPTYYGDKAGMKADKAARFHEALGAAVGVVALAYQGNFHRAAALGLHACSSRGLRRVRGTISATAVPAPPAAPRIRAGC